MDKNLKEFKELQEKSPLDYIVKVYPRIKGKPKNMEPRPIKKKYTLNQLGERVDQLTETVDKLGKRVDQLVITVDKLAKFTIEGFKRIEARLDYNNLKKLPDNYKI